MPEETITIVEKVESPIVHPSEAQFAKDHPELEVASPKVEKVAKKAALESALESEEAGVEVKPASAAKKNAAKEQLRN